MIRWIKCLFSCLLTVLLLAVLPVGARAEGFSLAMPVEVQLKPSQPPKEETFQIQLKALTDRAPMPTDSQDGAFTLTLQGPGETEFPPIVFHLPGKYLYSITQIPGTTPRYTYDSAQYRMEVVLTNTSQGLSPMVVLSKEGRDEKAGALVFVNHYRDRDPVPNAEQPKTSDPFYPLPWLILMVTSLLGAVSMTGYLLVQDRRRMR